MKTAVTQEKEKRRYGRKIADQKSEKITIRLTPHSHNIIRDVVQEAIGPISLSEMMERIARGELKLIKA